MNHEEAKKILFEGARNGKLNLVKEGLRIVKDVNNKDKYEMTPLHLASENGDLEIVKYLISNGADVNIRDNEGWTPLHYASYNGNLEIVKFLISNSVEINIKTKNGNTPLHLASNYGKLEVVKFLISKGADINIQNYVGWTPFHYVSYNGNLEIGNFLISNSADLKLENERTISMIKKFLKPTKEKIYRMLHLSRFLHQKYPGVEVISNILRSLFDSDEKLFSDEELIAIATFGTQNRPKVSLKTDEQKYQYLYYPLYEKYPHLFGYLQI